MALSPISGIGRVDRESGVPERATNPKGVDGGVDTTDSTNLKPINSAGTKPSSREQVAAGVNEKVTGVAKLYEKQFLREMVKAMRGSTELNDFMKPSAAEKIYREELDNEYVENWGENGGIGLQKIIYDQLMERFFSSSKESAQDFHREFNKEKAIALSNRDVLKAVPLKSSVPGQIPVKVELAPAEGGKSTSVQAPWDGKVLAQSRLQDGRSAVLLEHASGVRSSLVFDGISRPLSPGTAVRSGTQLGTLNPEKNSLLWNLSVKPQ